MMCGSSILIPEERCFIPELEHFLLALRQYRNYILQAFYWTLGKECRMSLCLSVSTQLHISYIPAYQLEPVFLGMQLLFFSEILHRARNRETDKSDKWIFQRNCCLPQNGQKVPKTNFFQCLQKFSITFCGSN